MREAKNYFGSEQEIREYVEGCEQSFSDRIETVCRRVFEEGSSIITLSGPTCSGKTTTAGRLADVFSKAGKTLHIISIDDFYYDREVLEERSKRLGHEIDLDSPDTIDMDAFSAAVDAISRRGLIELPKFDFKAGKRISVEKIDCDDNDAFLFEGIQAVYPALTAHLEHYKYSAVFISVEEGISIGKETFEARELRFMRRLVRDLRSRGSDAEFTYSVWQGVCKNEDAHIYPNVSNRHMRINSVLPYEINVIAPFVRRALLSIDKGSEYFDDALRLLKKLEGVVTIDEKYVPRDSVFREFIG